MDWSTIHREHVAQACDLLAAGQHRPRVSAKGLFVIRQNQRLPAKQVIRLAYCIANSLPLDTDPKFASGEGTLKLLRALGFEVTRMERTGDRSNPTSETSQSS
jgi:hypothetical protein